MNDNKAEIQGDREREIMGNTEIRKKELKEAARKRDKLNKGNFIETIWRDRSKKEKNLAEAEREKCL